jgi:hypothetical protein
VALTKGAEVVCHPADAGFFSAGVAMAPNKHASLFTRYQGEFSSGGHFSAVDLGLSFQF